MTAATLLKRDFVRRCFPTKFLKKYTYFEENLQTAASDKMINLENCSIRKLAFERMNGKSILSDNSKLMQEFVDFFRKK